MNTTGKIDWSVVVELGMIFVSFWDGDDVGVKPCLWIGVVYKDCVQGVEKGLLCGETKVFEEFAVEAIWSRGGGASVVYYSLKFQECEWCVIGEEVGWVFRRR